MFLNIIAADRWFSSIYHAVPCLLKFETAREIVYLVDAYRHTLDKSLHVFVANAIDINLFIS